MSSFIGRSLTKSSLIRPLISKRIFQAALSSGCSRPHPLILRPDRIVMSNPSLILNNRRLFATENDQDEDLVVEDEADVDVEVAEDDWMDKRSADPKDRTRVIPLEVSMAYMDSAAYHSTYGDKKIWELYRRNFSKGKTFLPTRQMCIRNGRINTGNPCPICRDEYLVIDYRNLKLLNQFLSDYNGELLSSQRTGVCQRQYDKLVLEIERAKDRGLLKVDPPFVEYDYSYYKPKEMN